MTRPSGTPRFLLCCLALTACDPAEPAASAQIQGRIVVRFDEPRHPISPMLFGHNLQWTHGGDGLLERGEPDAKFHPEVISNARSIGVTSMRFPGGALANTYRWTAGIGERGSRPPGLDFVGKEMPSRFGTDEFVRLSGILGCPGVITVNLSAGAKEAADWVEYVNGDEQTPWGRKRIANGNARPMGVIYWEIGNELYSPKEHGHLSAEAYGRKVIAFAEAMKARDPSIKIGAHLEASFQKAAWIKSKHPHFLTWNAQVLNVAGRHLDFVALHFYAPFDKIRNEEHLHRLVWAGPLVFEQTVRDIKKRCKEVGADDLEIAVTEYGTFFGGRRKPDDRIATTENGLFNALMLFAFMRDPQIRLANHWSLLNNGSFGLLETQPRFSRRPAAAIFDQLGALANHRVLPLVIDVAGYAVKAKGNIPRFSSVKFLDGVAAERTDGSIKLAVVNRSPRRSILTELKFEGAEAPDRLTVRSLRPTDDHGQAWRTGETWLTAIDPGVFSVRLPPYSLTLLSGRRSGGKLQIPNDK